MEAIKPPKEQGDVFVLADVIERKGGSAITIAKAYRRRPMIDVLLEKAVLTVEEHRALRHYRHHADIADRSPMRDTLAKLMRVGGGGTGPTVEVLNAIRVRDDCERAAGSLVDILRAVVVYDMSLSQWAIERSGGVENCRDRRGKLVCQIEPRQKAMEIAKLEIRVAAKRVQSELDA